MAVAKQLDTNKDGRRGLLALIPTVSGDKFKVRLLTSTCKSRCPAADKVNEQRVIPGFSDEDLITALSTSLECGWSGVAKLSFLKLAARACESGDAARRANLVELGLPMVLAQRLLEVPQGSDGSTEARKLLLGGLVALAGKERPAREALGALPELPDAVVATVRTGTSDERQLGAAALEALGQDEGPLQHALQGAGCIAALVAVVQQAEVTAEFDDGAACKALEAVLARRPWRLV